MSQPMFSQKIWTVEQKTVYRRDQASRIKQVFEVLVPESLHSNNFVEKEFQHDTNRPVCQSL